MLNSKALYITLIVLLYSSCITSRCINTKYEQQPDEFCDYNYCDVIDHTYILCENISFPEIFLYLDKFTQGRYHIFISNSYLPILDKNVHSWEKVSELNIQHTNTTTFIPGFFNQFAKLQSLTIANNKLNKIIPGSLNTLKSLTKLNLSNNEIENLTEYSFLGLPNLEYLDLSNNKISVISPDIFKHQNFLKGIFLAENYLKEDYNIFSQNTLKQIVISKNKLISFNFSQIASIELIMLDISNNMIENVTDLNRLQVGNLSLANNKIKMLNSIGKVSMLNISNNNIDAVEINFTDSSVHVLDFSKNNITKISSDSFKEATELEYLYLDHNNINSIATDAFNKQENLKYLSLTFNELNGISFGLFNNLYQLKYLDISNNNMTLNLHTLLNLKNLEVLKFKNVVVKNFDFRSLSSIFRHLNSITLNDNVWNCGELATIVHLLKQQNIKFAKGTKTNDSNILGISCNDNVNLKEETITLKRNTQQSFVHDKQAPMENFFNRDFKNTTFYKFFKNFTIQHNTNEKHNNNEFLNYTEKNFTNTDLYKYIEDVKKTENKTSYAFLKILNFFEQNFNQTKYMNSFKQLATKNTSYSALTENSKSSNNLQLGNQINQIVTNILLIFILFSVLYLLYYHISLLKQTKKLSLDQVQLM